MYVTILLWMICMNNKCFELNIFTFPASLDWSLKTSMLARMLSRTYSAHWTFIDSWQDFMWRLTLLLYGPWYEQNLQLYVLVSVFLCFTMMWICKFCLLVNAPPQSANISPKVLWVKISHKNFSEILNLECSDRPCGGLQDMSQM